MPLDMKQVRFFVVKENEKIQLNGILHEGVDCKVLDEFVEKNQTIDFSQLKYVSWQALNNLHNYLENLNKDITLSNIPLHIYQCLKLIQNFSEKIHLEQFELKFLNLSDKDCQREVYYVTEAEITELSVEKKYFANIRGRLFFGFNDQVWPKNSLFKEKLPKLNKDEDSLDIFYFNYMFFSLTTLFLARDLVHAVCISLSLILNDLINLLEKFQASLKVIGVDLPDKPIKAIKNLYTFFDEILDREVETMGAIIEKYESVMSHYQKNMMTVEPDQFDKSGWLIEVCEEVKKTEPVTLALEKIGSDCGEAIFTDYQETKIRNEFKNLDPSSVNPEKLKEIRDCMCIMNPMSEDSWEETLEDIEEDLDLLSTKYEKCSPIIQGFDLTRQVLEHRIYEHKHITQVLQAEGDVDWASLESELIKKIQNTLVTQQEKYSFEYYIGDLIKKDEKSEKQGEALSPGTTLVF